MRTFMPIKETVPGSVDGLAPAMPFTGHVALGKLYHLSVLWQGWELGDELMWIS